MKLMLKIFVTQDCLNCAESHLIAHRIQQDYPDLSIEIIDIGRKRITILDPNGLEAIAID